MVREYWARFSFQTSSVSVGLKAMASFLYLNKIFLYKGQYFQSRKVKISQFSGNIFILLRYLYTFQTIFNHICCPLCYFLYYFEDLSSFI